MAGGVTIGTHTSASVWDRCRVTEPLNGWLSAKCVEVLPQGVRGGPVPRCDDYEACFEPAEPQRVAKKLTPYRQRRYARARG